MPKIVYALKKFSAATKAVIRQAIDILDEYAAQGFDLTLRQLYYQFVARDLLPNVDRSYKRLGSIINDARMAGLIDWNRIVDRTRNLRSLAHWNDPSDLVRAAARQFRVDKWDTQPFRIEVWIEKDALVGVIEGVCEEHDVPYFSCRGYTSVSEVWGASQRLGRYLAEGKQVRILHLGDHDPSGIDMTRDIEDRLLLFLRMDEWRRRVNDRKEELDVDDLDQEEVESIGNDVWPWVPANFQVDRLALNMDQVQQYNPPPNPAKVTDSRFEGYRVEHGDDSWELDALEPNVLAALIVDAVESYRDDDAWAEAEEREHGHRELLTAASARWREVATFLNGQNP